MTITTTKLYKLLSSQMNEETAETLTNFIEEKVKEDVDSRTEIFLTKDDKVELLDKINETRSDIMEKFNELPVTLKNVFLTKDDKIDLIEKINKMQTVLLSAIAVAVAIIGILIKVKF